MSESLAEIVQHRIRSVLQCQGGVDAPFYSALVANTDALALYGYLAAVNGPAAEFMVADGLGPARGWPQRFVPQARRALLDLGVLKCVRRPRKGVPALYRWAAPDLSDSLHEREEVKKGLPIEIDRSCGGRS